MQRHRPCSVSPASRQGTVLVLTSVGLVAMVGMMFLVFETGRAMAKVRQVQNASDASALAAAQILVRRQSNSLATATANQYVTEFNDLSGATVTVSMPPTSGPYAGRLGYAESKVRCDSATPLLRSMGIANSANLTSRAVAGYRSVAAADLVIALDRQATPGLNCVGNGQLIIDGGCITNSQGWGVDENGGNVDGYANGYAGNIGSNGSFKGRSFKICGGVNNPAGFQPYIAGGDSPLKCRAGLYPDPLINLPTPTVATGVVNIDRGRIRVSSTSYTGTFNPGIYSEINVSGGTVTLNPGIYVINGGELKVTGGTFRAQGVMFYITTNDYDPNTGLPDANDRESAPLRSGAQRGGASVTSDATLHALSLPSSNPGSIFNGVLVYLRRANDMPVAVAGNATAGQVTGTIYAKWSQLTLTGQGVFNTQFVVGNVKWSGNGNMTIMASGYDLAKGNLVYLVE
ncbi:MAG: pilus assembly protein TadG-related protein [Planctomycetaceae bacterium]